MQICQSKLWGLSEEAHHRYIHLLYLPEYCLRVEKVDLKQSMNNFHTIKGTINWCLSLECICHLTNYDAATIELLIAKVSYSNSYMYEVPENAFC
jgi:hypothetical protein